MALSANTVWECRSSGNDGNGGGFVAGASGTDYSQQDAAQVSYTDLVIGASANLLSSSANPFTSAHVGNLVNITSGTGFTVGRYEIVSVDGSNIATLDRNAGTIASTGGSGKLGGALLSPGIAAASAVTANAIWCNGTFTVSSSSQNVANGCVSIGTGILLAGYSTTRGDRGKAILDVTHTGGTSAVQITGNYGVAAHIRAQTSSATGSGFTLASRTSAVDCEAVGFDDGGNDAGFTGSAGGTAIGCYAQDCRDGFSNINTVGCVAKSCDDWGFEHGAERVSASACIAIACGVGFSQASINSLMSACVAYDCGAGFIAQNNTRSGRFINCIAAGCSGVGFQNDSTGDEIDGAVMLLGCAGYNNTGGNKSGSFTLDFGFIALTVDPFVNAAADDFRLNETTSGGPELYDTAYPTAWPGIGTPNHSTIGAAGPENFGVRASGGLMYPLGRKKLLDADVDLLVDDIRVAFVLDTYTFSGADEFLDDVDLATNGASGALSSKSTTGGVFDAADSTATPDSAQDVNALVIYGHTGTAGTSPLIAYLNGFTPFTTTGAAVPLIWSDGAERIFAIVDQAV